MKILQVTPYFYPSVGGGQVYVLNLSRELVKIGVEVDILTINSENVKKQEILFKKVRVYRCSLDFKYSRGLISLEFFRKIFTKKGYDLYHVHLPFPLGFEATIMTTRLNNIPIVATHHGQVREGNLLFRTIVGPYDVFFKKVSARYVSQLMFLTQSYPNSLGLSREVKEKARIISPAVDSEKFSPSKDGTKIRRKYGLNTRDKVILYVGPLRLDNRFKKVDLLLKAMDRVRREITDTRVVLVGEGGLVPELKQLAQQLELEKEVIFAGYVPEDDLPLYYAMCDVVVLPSSHEPCGLVLLEAMASGKPAIACDVPGARDNIRHGEDGLKVCPRDSEALADAIVYLLKNDELRNEMSRNARKKVESYTWGKLAQEVKEVYREMIGS